MTQHTQPVVVAQHQQQQQQPPPTQQQQQQQAQQQTANASSINNNNHNNNTTNSSSINNQTQTLAVQQQQHNNNNNNNNYQQQQQLQQQQNVAAYNSQLHSSNLFVPTHGMPPSHPHHPHSHHPHHQPGATMYPTMIPTQIPSNVYVNNVTANVNLHGWAHTVPPGAWVHPGGTPQYIHGDMPPEQGVPVIQQMGPMPVTLPPGNGLSGPLMNPNAAGGGSRGSRRGRGRGGSSGSRRNEYNSMQRHPPPEGSPVPQQAVQTNQQDMQQQQQQQQQHHHQQALQSSDAQQMMAPMPPTYVQHPQYATHAPQYPYGYQTYFAPQQHMIHPGQSAAAQQATGAPLYISTMPVYNGPPMYNYGYFIPPVMNPNEYQYVSGEEVGPDGDERQSSVESAGPMMWHQQQMYADEYSMNPGDMHSMSADDMNHNPSSMGSAADTPGMLSPNYAPIYDPQLHEQMQQQMGVMQLYDDPQMGQMQIMHPQQGLPQMDDDISECGSQPSGPIQIVSPGAIIATTAPTMSMPPSNEQMIHQHPPHLIPVTVTGGAVLPIESTITVTTTSEQQQQQQLSGETIIESVIQNYEQVSGIMQAGESVTSLNEQENLQQSNDNLGIDYQQVQHPPQHQPTQNVCVESMVQTDLYSGCVASNTANNKILMTDVQELQENVPNVISTNVEVIIETTTTTPVAINANNQPQQQQLQQPIYEEKQQQYAVPPPPQQSVPQQQPIVPQQQQQQSQQYQTLTQQQQQQPPANYQTATNPNQQQQNPPNQHQHQQHHTSSYESRKSTQIYSNQQQQQHHQQQQTRRKYDSYHSHGSNSSNNDSNISNQQQQQQQQQQPAQQTTKTMSWTNSSQHKKSTNTVAVTATPTSSHAGSGSGGGNYNKQSNSSTNSGGSSSSHGHSTRTYTNQQHHNYQQQQQNYHYQQQQPQTRNYGAMKMPSSPIASGSNTTSTTTMERKISQSSDAGIKSQSSTTSTASTTAVPHQFQTQQSSNTDNLSTAIETKTTTTTSSKQYPSGFANKKQSSSSSNTTTMANSVEALTTPAINLAPPASTTTPAVPSTPSWASLFAGNANPSSSSTLTGATIATAVAATTPAPTTQHILSSSTSTSTNYSKKPIAKVAPYEGITPVTPTTPIVTPGNMSYSAASAQNLPTPNTAAVSLTAATKKLASDQQLLSSQRNSVANLDEYSLKFADFLTKYKSDWTTISLRPRGLTNRSNYCYINSILQALLGCSPLYNLIRSIPKQAANLCEVKTPTINAMITFMSNFSNLPSGLRLRNTKPGKGANKDDLGGDLQCDPAFEPTEIYKLWNDSREEHVEGRQEDAEEFLSYILNKLNDEMLEVIKLTAKPSLEPNGQTEQPEEEGGDVWQMICNNRNKGSVTRQTDFGCTPLSDIYRGELRSRLQREGEHSTDVIQPFFTLQLNIEKAASVKEALEILVGRDQLEGVTGSKTKQEVVAWQQMNLEKLPPILILHLKWFDYRSDGCTKIIKKVEFPVELKIDAKILASKKYSQKQRAYRLFAVVYHDGKEATKGHYITDVYHTGYGSWLRYDDSSVKPVSENHVLLPRTPRVPYLLCYRRCDTITQSHTSSSSSQAHTSTGGNNNNLSGNTTSSGK